MSALGNIIRRVGEHVLVPFKHNGKMKSLAFDARLSDEEIAQRLARHNEKVSLPEGALDMAHEARMQRAKEMGFDVDNTLYHASQQDIDKFVAGYADGMAFLTPSKKFANDWLGKGKYRGRKGGESDVDSLYNEKRAWKEKHYDEFARSKGYKDFNDLYGKDGNTDELYLNYRAEMNKAFPVAEDDLGKTIYPVTTNTKKTFDPERDFDVIREYVESLKGTNRELPEDVFRKGHYMAYETPGVAKLLKDKGYDSVKLRESLVMGADKEPYTTIATLNTKNTRSTNAVFDPAKKESSNLLASAAPIGLATGMALTEDEAEAGVINKAGKKVIDMWHGTPHNFDKFDMSKIGTGEGAQAYGHGLYGADKRAVAEEYQRVLTRNGGFVVDGKVIMDDDITPLENGAMRDVARYGYDNALMYAEQMKKEFPSMYEEGFIDEIKKLKDVSVKPNKGSLYNVHFDATPDELLDWDKPLEQQPEMLKKLGIENEAKRYREVNDRLNDMMIEDMDAGLESNNLDSPEWTSLVKEAREIRQKLGFAPTDSGEDIYQVLGSGQKGSVFSGDQLLATNKLKEKGIKGIQYLDGTSRGAGEGTKNYVAFDDKLLSIAKKYGIAPAAVTTAMLMDEEQAGASLIPTDPLLMSQPDMVRSESATFTEGSNDLLADALTSTGLITDKNRAYETADWLNLIGGFNPVLGAMQFGSDVGDMAYDLKQWLSEDEHELDWSN